MASITEGGFLSGKKTYLAAALVVITAVFAYLGGEMNLSDALTQAFTGGGLGFLRAGVAKAE